MTLVIAEKLKPDVQNLSFDTSSHQYLFYAALILPYETKTMLPDGINWLRIAIDKTSSAEMALNNREIFFYCEKRVQKLYYKHLREIKVNKELCRNLIFLNYG